MAKTPKKELTVDGTDPYDFSIDRNGLAPIFYKRLPWSTSININFFFAFGARHDPKGKEGLAHFLEHLLLDGSSRFKDKFEQREFSRLYALNSMNAGTSFAFFQVTASCLPEHFERVSGAIADMISTPKLSDADIEHERKVITQEIWASLLNDKHVEYIKSDRRNIYGSFPDRQRIYHAFGWADTIQNISRKDLVAFHKKYVGTSNLTVFLTGAIEPNHIKHVKKLVKAMPKATEAPGVKIPKTIKPPKESENVLTYEEVGLADKKQALINIGSVSSKNEYRQSMIGVISRNMLYELLHRKIRLEKSWCYSVGVSEGRYIDHSTASISIRFDPAFKSEAATEVWSIVHSVINGEQSAEFEKSKNVILNSIKATEFTSKSVMDAAQSEYVYHGRITSLNRHVELCQKVTYADVQKFVAKSFNKKRIHTEIQVPNEYSNGKKGRK